MCVYPVIVKQHRNLLSGLEEEDVTVTKYIINGTVKRRGAYGYSASSL
jgi:hypothetical protein